EIAVEGKPGHLGPVSFVIVRTPASGVCVAVGDSERWFEQWMGAVDARVEYTHGWRLPAGRRGALEKLLGPLALFVRPHIDEARGDLLRFSNVRQIVQDIDRG